MGKPAESVTLDDDVEEELRKLAERSGQPLGVVANAALRDYVRLENQVVASIERGVADLEAGRARSTEEVLAHLSDEALAALSLGAVTHALARVDAASSISISFFAIRYASPGQRPET